MNRLAPLALILAMAFGIAGCGSTCKGNDLEQTNEIIHEAYLSGARLAMSKADSYTKMNAMLLIIAQLTERAKRLPKACRAIVMNWGQQISSQQSLGGGTQCLSGVCCNYRECVGG